MAQETDINSITDFIVNRSDLRITEFSGSDVDQDLKPGQIWLKIDRFGLSANNITYAVFGEAMSYWNFFPTKDGWGRVPVWGFADIVQSNADGLEVGERVYGYFPMSRDLVVDVVKLTDSSFIDGAEHRKDLSLVYNQYIRVKSDPGYDADQEELQMLFRPLFMTSFLIEDFLQDNNLFGAEAVVLSSASSKTSISLAWCLANNPDSKARIIGLTSAANKEFVDSLGVYTDVLSYQDLGLMPASQKTVFVDMAGNGQLLHDIHHHFQDNLKYSCMVGGTHWENRQTQHALPGAKPEFFFAPTQGQKRQKDWGSAVFQQKLAASWIPFVQFAAGWVEMQHADGWVQLKDAYLEMLEGNTDPKSGYVISLSC